MNPNESLSIAAVVVTRDRHSDLNRLLTTLAAQENVDLNVLIYDDASEAPVITDGVPIERIRVIRCEDSRGPTPHRLNSLRDCTEEFVLWLDDDVSLPYPKTIAEALSQLANRSELAAIGIPLIEPQRTPSGSREFQDAVNSDGRRNLLLRSFLGGSVILKREVASDMPIREGYHRFGGEEHDLAIRLIDAGWNIGYADTEPVIHWVSPIRDKAQKFIFDARSGILFEFLNMPIRDVTVRVLRKSLGLWLHGIRTLGIYPATRGVFAGFFACLTHATRRRGIKTSTLQRIQEFHCQGVEKSTGNTRSQVGGSEKSQSLTTELGRVRIKNH